MIKYFGLFVAYAVCYLSRYNHGDRFAHASGSMQLVESEYLTLTDVTPSLRHETQASLKQSTQ